MGRDFSTFNSDQVIDFRDKSKGYYCSRGRILLCCLAAIVICVIVALIVYYEHPDRRAKDDDDDSHTGGQRHGECMTTSTAAPPGPTVPGAPAGPVNVRLPDTLVPYHYNVWLRPHLYGSDPGEFFFEGEVDIYLTVRESTSEIKVHIKSLEIDKNDISAYYLPDNTEIAIDKKNVKEEPTPLEFLVIPTTAELVAGRNIMVRIAYTGPLRKDLQGIYISDYVNDEGETVYLLTSQLQATDARKVFPCLDEPALKATFNVTIEHRSSLHTKSNMEIIRSEPQSGGWIADVYDTTPIMSTYLLAFLVSDFQCRNRVTRAGQLVEICARPNAYDQLDFANSIAVEMQEWFEQYYNISYPLHKMTHAAVPDFSAGAMENWGLILYRETALLYDPVTSSTANQKRVAYVVSHELAHMWFGDLITPNWWDDLWLNEGFASYMQLLGVHNVHDYDQWQMEEQFVVEDMQYVMIEDSLVTSHPIYVPVNDPAEISAIFDLIAYYKGSSVIRMMKYFLGEETFRWGLSNYLKDNLYGVTDHTDLFRFLTQQSANDGKDVDVADIMNTWIRQMGYPVVKATYDRDNQKLLLSQKHFLLDPEAEVTTSSEYNYIWKIPISYTTDVSPPTNLDALDITWLNEPQGSVDDVTTQLNWFILNVGMTFYYRVNYETENWNALINQLVTDHRDILDTSRAQIIDDLFQQGRAGEVDQVLALSALQYMGAERSYLPWYSVASNMGYIRRMMNKGPGRALLQSYIQNLVGGVVSDLGYVDSPSDQHLDLRLRALILSLACVYDLEDCLTTTSQIYQTWMSDNTTVLSVNFARVILCNGIGQGGTEEWTYGYQRYLASNSGNERTNLLVALACTKQTWLLERYLHWALSEERGIRQQDMRTVLVSVSNNPLGTYIAWSFFKANWHIFRQRFGEVAFTLGSMVEGLTRTFSTDWELADLQDFMARNPDQGAAHRSFQKAVETTKGNIKWRQQHEENIIDWLRNNV